MHTDTLQISMYLYARVIDILAQCRALRRLDISIEEEETVRQKLFSVSLPKERVECKIVFKTCLSLFCVCNR